MPMWVHYHTWSIFIYNKKEETSPSSDHHIATGWWGRRTQHFHYFCQLIFAVASNKIKTLSYVLNKAFCPCHFHSIFHGHIHSLSFEQFIMDFISLLHCFVQCRLPLHWKNTVQWRWQLPVEVEVSKVQGNESTSVAELCWQGPL